MLTKDNSSKLDKQAIGIMVLIKERAHKDALTRCRLSIGPGDLFGHLIPLGITTQLMCENAWYSIRHAMANRKTPWKQ